MPVRHVPSQRADNCSDGEAGLLLDRDETEQYLSWRARNLIAERPVVGGGMTLGLEWHRSRSAINEKVSIHSRVCEATVPCLNLCITFKQDQSDASLWSRLLVNVN